MSHSQENETNVNVPALQARLAALNDMFIQAQSEIMDLRAAMKMRDVTDRSVQEALKALNEANEDFADERDWAEGLLKKHFEICDIEDMEGLLLRLRSDAEWRSEWDKPEDS
jgi:hypothetical protein